MPKKRGSLSRKNIIRLAVLGFILFLGTGLAGGIQLYRENIKVYKAAAESYVNMLCFQIAGIDIDGVIEHKQEIREVQKALRDYTITHDGSMEEEEYRKLTSDLREDVKNAFEAWYNIDSFVLGFGNICVDIQFAYVVIPTENDLIYVWDSEIAEDGFTDPFEHVPYSGKEKEHIVAVMRGDVDGDFFMDTTNGERFGTALCPVLGKGEEIRAVAAIDISVSKIRTAFMKLIGNIGIAIFLIMLASIMVYHYVVRKQIINPIVTLTQSADGLVNNLQKDGGEPIRVDVHTGDEIDVLARSFERMDAKLMDYIRENAAITAEKERIGTELSLAARIQKDMLPCIFPPFPGVKEIDLYASMDPAKEVGGDFYDYFMADGSRLWIVMADVSGKGIPAALFMMMSKIMVQNFAMIHNSPAEVLEQVNDQICRNPVEEMFVTVWLGVLDLQTGLLTAANAGHEYPILRKPGGAFELLKDRHGFVVGGLSGYQYREYQLQMEAGSRLFLYTDGLPEATNAQGQMFGIERTLAAVNEVREASPREVLEHVKQSMDAFVGSAPQFDDTTMLCVDYYGADSEA